MDQPGIPWADHQLALKGLARLNRASGAHHKVWKALSRTLTRDLSTPPTIHLLDIATGGADLPILLFQKARRLGLDLRVFAVDRSPGALDHALAACGKAGVPAQIAEGFPDRPGIHLGVRDALQVPNHLPQADWVTSSLFLHHLTNLEAKDLLARLATLATRALVVADLNRTPLNIRLVTLGSYLLSRSPMVHNDGPASVRAAFSVPEARVLAKLAGLTNAEVQPAFPGMWLLRLVRP